MELTKSRHLREEMGLWETGEKCRKCGAAMHRRINEEFDFCWECVVSNETARRGRWLLEKARLAMAGVTNSREINTDGAVL